MDEETFKTYLDNILINCSYFHETVSGVEAHLDFDIDKVFVSIEELDKRCSKIILTSCNKILLHKSRAVVICDKSDSELINTLWRNIHGIIGYYLVLDGNLLEEGFVCTDEIASNSTFIGSYHFEYLPGMDLPKKVFQYKDEYYWASGIAIHTDNRHLIDSLGIKVGA